MCGARISVLPLTALINMMHLPTTSRFALTLAGALCLVVPILPAADSATSSAAAKVDAYPMPDPLVCTDGTRVTEATTWRNKRRPEVLAAFETQIFGRVPAGLPKPLFEVTSVDRQVLAGKATRKLVTVWLLGRKDGPKLDVLVYLPNGVHGPVPVFCGLNFTGNHTVARDPGVPLPPVWLREKDKAEPSLVKASEESRGRAAENWQVDRLIARGYGLATACYNDIEPDFAAGWKLGVRGAASAEGADTVFAADEWGAIAASAWGLGRMLDYLETDRDVDAKRVAVIGHSRLGKAALWAGARDERFALVISNDSGEGGAAIARRNVGETILDLNTRFPHWFCANFRHYNGNASALPVDAHLLVALAAPRPVYVASAAEDRWADPEGEFLAAKNAGPVYALFGLAGVGVEVIPPVDHPVGAAIGYHVRTGKHAITQYDWEQYLAFADRHIGRGGPARVTPTP